MDQKAEKRGDLIGRLQQIAEALGSQAEVARRGKRGATAISVLLTQTEAANDGKPSKPTLYGLVGFARAARMPLWALLHPSDVVFDYYLARIKGEPVDTAFATAMSMAQTETADYDALETAWLNEIDLMVRDDRSMQKGGRAAGKAEGPRQPGRPKKAAG